MVKPLFFLIILIEAIFLSTILNLPDSSLSLEQSIYQKDATRIQGACIGLQYKEQCYAQQFEDLTKEKNLEHSVSTLLELQNIDPENSMGCHFIAHVISIAETLKDPSKWQEVIKRVEPYVCTGGFVHGAIETHALSDPSFKINGDSIDLICNKLLNDDGFSERSCNHIMGHLIMVQVDGNLKEAVLQCEKLPEFIPKYECLSGAFMENLTRESLITHDSSTERLMWNEQNTLMIEELCREYEGLAATACWKEISYMYAAINKSDPIKVFNSCQRAVNKEAADQCFIYGVGNMVNFSEFNFAKLNQACAQYDYSDPLFKTCMFQIIGSLLTTSEKNVDKTITLCKGTIQGFQPNCFNYITEVLERYGASQDIIEKVKAQWASQ